MALIRFRSVCKNHFLLFNSHKGTYFSSCQRQRVKLYKICGWFTKRFALLSRNEKLYRSLFFFFWNMPSTVSFQGLVYWSWDQNTFWVLSMFLVFGKKTLRFCFELRESSLQLGRLVGTIRRTLSKPPQRRQVPDPHPLWLFFGNPQSLDVSWRADCSKYSLLLLMSLDIFDILFLSPNMFVYWFLWHRRFRWILVLGLFKDDSSQFCKYVFFLSAKLLRLVRRLGFCKSV